MSYLDGVEEVFEQTSARVNERDIGPRRGIFGFRISPNLERVSVSRESTAIAKPAALISAVDDERGIASSDTPSGEQEMLIVSEPVTSYTELIGAIRVRVGQLGVRYLDFDKMACWAEGMSGKAFGAAQVKRLGPEKLFDAIRASGMRIRLEHDPEQTQKMQARIAENFNPRQANQARPNNQANIDQRTVDRVLIYLMTKKGGLARLNAAVKEARSNWARHAANVREAKRHFNNVSPISAVRTLPLPENRPALDSCAEHEATAAA